MSYNSINHKENNRYTLGENVDIINLLTMLAEIEIIRFINTKNQ